MPQAMILKHFYITRELSERLAEEAQKRDISQAQLVREALSWELADIGTIQKKEESQ